MKFTTFTTKLNSELDTQISRYRLYSINLIFTQETIFWKIVSVFFIYIYYYKMKWINWNDFYNQWLSKKNLNNVVELKTKFNERLQTSRKRKRSNFEKQLRKKFKKNNQIYEFIVVVVSLFIWIDFNFFDLISNINFKHFVKMSIFRSKNRFASTI